MVVLGVSMMVAVIGLSAITVNRIQRRSFGGTHDASIASDYAQSTIELALLKIKQDANWRQTYTHDTWVADQTIGRGTFKWKLVDTVDTDLNNDNTHAARLVAWGMVGNTTQKASVLLEPAGPALTCLEAAAHAGGAFFDIEESGDIVTATGGPLSTNGALRVWGTVNADVEANSTSGPGTINGTLTVPAPSKGVPNSQTVFDYYVANGTPIDINDLPLTSGTRQFDSKLLSPETNPYGIGQANSQGIYVIDCLGQKISFRNSRVVGTLVLLNVGADSEMIDAMNWEPAVPNYPALLVMGDMSMALDNSDLDESLLINFNPTGTPYPYPTGAEDTLLDDLYPSQITGLVYVSGDLKIMNNLQVIGVLVADGDMRTQTFDTASVSLTYSNTFLNNPPPGFMDGTDVRVMAGSWKKEVD